MTKEDAQLIGQIGYYNHNTYPISFAPRHRTSAPVGIDAGDPVVSDGKLVPYDRDLEEQVDMRLLRRIVPKDPNYAKFSKIASRVIAQAANPPAPPTAVARPAAVPNPLPDGASWVKDGDMAFIEYRGQRFNSTVALETWMDQQGIS